MAGFEAHLPDDGIRLWLNPHSRTGVAALASGLPDSITIPDDEYLKLQEGVNFKIFGAYHAQVHREGPCPF